jgi:hypothetical protein
MRKHNGMRPQDIVILLKMVSDDLNGSQNTQLKDIAKALYISPSEVTESLNRSQLAGLVDFKKKRVNRLSLLEFLKHGFHYVFPAEPGGMVNGIPTAHSHPFLQQYFESEQAYVWPDIRGEKRGGSIEPLYSKQVLAVKEDEQLYKLLALIDVLRVGRRREINTAVSELSKMILHEPSKQPVSDQSSS